MDYRERKYYLIACKWMHADYLDMMIKSIPKTKITKLKSTNIPNGYCKIMVSCLKRDSIIIENLINVCNKTMSYERRLSSKIYIKELTKDILGQ